MATPYTDHDNVINVVLHQNQFSDDENSYYGRVTRNTVTLEQLIKGILDDNENTNTGLNAYILNFAMDRMKARILAEIKAGRDPGEELGHLFFSCVNVARLAGQEPELLLKAATEKFIRRFTEMENLIISDEKSLDGLTLAEMDVYLNRVKQCGDMPSDLA